TEPGAGLPGGRRWLWGRRAARLGGTAPGRWPCETLPRPRRQPAQFVFLQTIRQGSHEQIAADARRLRAKEPSPFLAQRRAVELLQSIEARLPGRGGCRRRRRLVGGDHEAGARPGATDWLTG